MIRIPRMLLIGATEKDAGKTSLSEKIIRRFSAHHTLYGIKCTVLKGLEGRKGFSVFEEYNPRRAKDTGRLLSAGCRKVFWLKTDEEHTGEGIRKVVSDIPESAAILCESNSLAKYIRPGLFLMVRKHPTAGLKDSASEVMDRVDHFIVSEWVNDRAVYRPDPLDHLVLNASGWGWTEPSVSP